MQRKPKIFSAERRQYIERRINELAPWYHKIELGDGIVTPGLDFDRIWDSIARVMDAVDYRQKRVLDLASWDGMWAFSAEARGAKQVVSTDIRLEGYPNLLFAREVLESSVIPMCNVPVQDLANRLKMVGLEPTFDIVHHLGLFYHLRDPLLSLAQARAVMSTGGLMILETAYIDDDKNSYMAFSGLPDNHHFYGISDTWAPTKLCLREVLVRSQFEPVMEEHWQSIDPPRSARMKSKFGVGRHKLPVGRIAMVARAVDTDLHKIDLLKIQGIQ